MRFLDELMLIPSKAANALSLKYKHVQVGKNVSIQGRIYIFGRPEQFEIHDSVRIISNRKYNPVGGNIKTTFALGPEARVSIGEKTGISNSVFKIMNGLTIGKNVNIGGDCKIYDTDMHSVEYRYRVNDPDEHIKTAPIVIEDGVWIGGHSLILKGVTIGARSVIGAGSVVTRNIPPDEIWAGNPAKFIRKINENDREYQE